MNNKQNMLSMLETCISNSRAVRNSIVENHIGSTDPDARIINRLWKLNETAAMLGISRQTIKNREDDGSLPPPRLTANGRRDGYTIYDIERMRQFFNQRPCSITLSDGDNDEKWHMMEYSQKLNCVTLAILGHKGGSYKTTVSVHFAQWLAMNGFRVLLIDSDPQATTTRYMGLIPDVDIKRNDTLYPFMVSEEDDLSYAPRATHWPKLDLIPSCLAMHNLDRDMAQQNDDGELAYPIHLMLRAGIETISDNYDVVLIDGSPNLGTGTLNQVFAGDVCVCPTPAELNDYASTEQFFSAMYSLIRDIDDAYLDYLPDLRVLITKYSFMPGSSSHLMDQEIRKAWGALVLDNRVKITEEIGKGQLKSRSIYEQSADERSGLSAWKNADLIFSPLFKEILHNLIQPRWTK